MSSAALCAGKIPLAPSDSASPVRIVSPLESADWDEQVASLPGGSFFHGTAWARVLERTYGFRPLYLVASRGDEMESALPLMEVNSWLTGRRGVSLPFADQCGRLGAAEDSRNALVEEALRLGRARRWKYLECRGESGLAETTTNAPLPSLRFYGHRLNLAADSTRILGQFESATRRAIRKAEKSNLTFEISRSLPAVREYYALHCRTRRQHGLPPQPFKFFRNIHRFILAQERGMVISAKHQGRAVASAVFFEAGSEMLYKFGASDKAFQELRPNNLVMWEAVKWCVRHGKKALDFGRTSLANEGLRRFKLGWGAEEREIRYYKFDFRKSEFITDKDDTSGWHVALFRSLPIFLSRWIGAAMYKHVA